MTHFTTLYQRYIQSTWFIIICLVGCSWFIVVDIDLDVLAAVVLVWFLHIKLPPPLPLLYYALWKQVTMPSSHIRRGELYSPSFRGEHLHKLFGILWHGKFVSSLPFINFSHNLFISV